MQKYLFILLLLILSCDEALGPEDCAGVAGGNAVIDFCGVCVSIIDNVIHHGYVNLCEGSSENNGTVNGICDGGDNNWPYGGGPNMDECGVCYGSGILDGECDCDGNVEDCAGECGGDSIIDCADECGGIAYIDDCSNCVGGSTGLYNCADIQFLEDWLDCSGNSCLLDALEYVTFENGQIATINEGYSVSYCPGLPESIGNLSALIELNCTNSGFSTLPSSFGNISQLKYLKLGGNDFTSIPESIFEIDSLLTLNLNENNISSIPDDITALNNLKKLELSENQFSIFPDNLGALENLMKLDLGYNNIESLPSDILSTLTNLGCLNLEHNQISILPETIGQLPLFALDFSSNLLTELPEAIGDINPEDGWSLLDFRFNQLISLPLNICNIENYCPNASAGVSCVDNSCGMVPDWSGYQGSDEPYDRHGFAYNNICPEYWYSCLLPDDDNILNVDSQDISNCP